MTFGQATKLTIWTELKWSECTIIKREGVSVQIQHPLLKRARWFNPSARGNYYSRYTGKDWSIDREAEGYILVGPIPPELHK